MYRRIIKEFPKYEEIAAVHYYLGHAYTDAGRIDEGQQAWRALVCSNRYNVKDDPAEHGISIEAFQVKKVVNRGKAETVEFKADKAGIFPITCHLHPAHVGTQLVVQEQ